MKTRLLAVKCYILVTFCVLASMPSLHATPYSWTGNSTLNWGDNASWVPNTGHPVAGDTATFPSGLTVAKSSLVLGSAQTVDALIFNINQTFFLGSAGGGNPPLSLGNASGSSITQNGASTVFMFPDVTCADPCTLGGTGAGTVNMIGSLLGNPALTVNGAVYGIGPGNAIGGITLQSITVNGGTLVVGVSNNVTVSGAVVVNNGGTLRLCNPGVAGVGFSAASLTVNSGGTLYGSSTVSSAITGSGTINPGCSAGTLTVVGGLTLTSSAVLDFELSTPGAVGSGVNDLIDVTGSLNLDGTLNVTPLPGFGIGTYRLFNYSSALTGPGLTLSSVPAGYSYQIDTTTPGQVNLLVTPAGTGTNCCANCAQPYPLSYTNSVAPGDNFFANNLCQGTNNTLNDILPNVPDGTELLIWNEATQSYTVQIYDSASGGWVDSVGNPSTGTLQPGQGFVLENTSGAIFSIVIRGCQPTCPPPCSPPTNGYALVGRLGIGTATWTNLFSCPPPCGARMSIYNPNTGFFDNYDYANGVWTPFVPGLAVGQSAFVSVQPNTNCLSGTNCVPVPANLALWLPFDETSGTTSANLAPGGNNGMQVNSPSANLGSYVANSLCFNGANQYVTVPDYPAINPGTGNLSIDAWVLRSSASGTTVRVIVDKRDLNTGIGYSLSVSFGNLVFQLADSSGFTNYRDTGTVPADDQWHFVAVTVNRTSTNGGRFYIDGAATGIFDPTGQPGSLNNTSAFQVAASQLGGNSPWLGCIDEVEFFRRALAATEIQSIYSAGSGGKCKSPCSTPAVISCATNKTVVCGSAWTFNPPTATPPFGCTNVNITIQSTVTNGLCPKLAVRIWLITDCCGGSNLCSQTVTLVDTTPPTITCSGSKTVACGTTWSFNAPTSTDTCSGTNVTVTFTTVTNGVCPQVFTRTWTATDLCGNTNTCSQTVTVVSCVPPPSGMVGWWPLDETSGTTVAEIVSGLNGTASPGPIGPIATINGPAPASLWPPVMAAGGPKVGGAFYFWHQFDNRFVRVPHNNALTFATNDFSIDAWVFITQYNGTEIQPIVEKMEYSGTTPVRGYRFYMESGVLTFQVVGTSGIATTPVGIANQLTQGVWHHVAVTYQRPPLSQNQFIVLYIDGVLAAINNLPNMGDLSNTSDLIIGGSILGSAINYLDIAIDELEIFNRALAQQDIQAIFNAGPAGKCKTPVLVCATNKVVQCGTAWTFNPPVVNPPCNDTNLNLTILSTVTNGVCPTVVTRTWQVVDTCGHTNTCSQTVTIVSCVPPPSGMTLWLPFDETSGTTSVNLAGGNNGTQINGPSVNLGSYVANSLCFNGANQYVEVTDYPAINIGTGDFSVDAWVKPATLDSTIRVIVDHRAETATTVGYSLFLGGNNGIGFQIGDGAFINYPSTFVVPVDGQWHHVAVTVKRNNPQGIHFFLDGVVGALGRDPTPYSGSITPPPTYPLRVGSRSSSVSGLFPGCIDEVEVFNRELATNEVQSLFNAGSAGKCKSPVLICATNKVVQCDANWSFDPPTVIDPCGGGTVTPAILSTVTNGVGHITFNGGGSTADGVVNIVGGTAISGYLNITAGSKVGTYVLSPGGGIDGSFQWDGLVFPASDPFVDAEGLLFTGGGFEINLFGDGPGSYSFVGAPPNYDPNVTNGVATLSLCPQIITRTWLYLDACGHSNTCSQTVTVVDTTPPVITCPSNIVVTVCTNAGVVINYTVTATDNCCNNVTIGSTPPSGSVFQPGTTTVSCTATDCCGNVSTCSFTVTVNVVNDTTPPIFTTYCTTSHIVIGGNNFASAIAASPSSNLVKRLQNAGVTCFRPFDVCSVNCYFAHTFTNLSPCITAATLTVRLKPCGDICENDAIHLSFTGAGGTLLGSLWSRYLGSGNPQTGLLADDWCGHTSGQVFTFDLAALPQPSGSPLNFISALNANGFLDLTSQDDSGVDYAILDVVSCCCATNKSIPFGTPWNFDQPSVFDAVWGTNVTVTSITSTSSVCPLIVTRTWIATDPCGNVATCSQTVTVGSAGPCQIFNTGMSGVNGNIPGTVGSLDPHFALLSSPGAGTSCLVEGSLPGSWVPNSTTSQWVGPAVNTANSPVGVYHYQMVFILCCTNNSQMNGRMAVDDTAGLYLNGNFAGSVIGFSSFTPVSITSGFVPGVNVLDIYVTNAVIYTGLRAELTNCSGGMVVICPATSKLVDCGSKWNFDLPVASSCCSSNISIVVTAAATNGVCPKTATRTWRITDGCGNTNFCTQVVTIRDVTPPAVICPTNRIIVALDSNCNVRIPLIQPKASDNCTPASQLIYTQNPPAGAIVPGPCQLVTVTVKDLCNNASQCQVLVCGQDKTPPTVLYPKSINVTNCIVPNVLPFLIASDNCTPSNKLVFTQSPPAGTPIAAGGNIVTVTVTDQAGNTTVIVISIVNSGSQSFLASMFNTGVNASKAVLPNGSVDPHYTLGPVPAGLLTGPGFYNVPNAIVTTYPWGLPPFMWSQWIAPMTNSVFCLPGSYTYTNQFVLPSGGNPLTASISGRWAADNGAKMYLNGLAPANQVSFIATPLGFNHWTYFTANSGFLAFPAVNKLYCVVSNLDIFTGVRVEITNAVINCSTCTPPAVVWMTPNQSRPLNSTAVFTVSVWGTPPLTYQWYHNGSPLSNGGHYSGVNTANLVIAPVGYADAGTYYVVISNPCGTIKSKPAKLTVTKGWFPWPWAWWNFAQLGNPMAATVGPDLILTGTNTLGISSGSTVDFDLPNIGGNIANVMHVPALSPDTFIQLPFVAPPESNSVSSYTIIMDVYAQSNSAGPSTLFNIRSPGPDSVRALTAQDDRLVVSGTVGGELVNLIATTPMPTGTWSRVVLVVDNPKETRGLDLGNEQLLLDDANTVLGLYVNGEPVGSTTVPTPYLPAPGLTIDWSLDIPATLFSSPPGTGLGTPAGTGTDGDTYVSSIQFHAVAMTPEMIAGLGGPDTTPIPANDTSVGIQPVLSAAMSNGIVNFSWAGSAFTLQETTDLTSGVWVNSGLPFDESEVNGDILTVAHASPATEGPAKFYRLIYAP